MTSPHEGRPQTVATGIAETLPQVSRRRALIQEIGTRLISKGEATPGDIPAFYRQDAEINIAKRHRVLKMPFIDLLGGAHGTSESSCAGCNMCIR